MITAKTFYDPFSNTGTTIRRVEISDIIEIDGRRGHVVALGRKYVTVLIYGGKRIKISPLAANFTPTGETHW